MNDSRSRLVAEMLEQAETMGLFPAAAVKIRAVSSDPDATVDDMERAVSLDATLGAQILKLANSPFYGLPRKVSTLHQAIFVLGFSAIQQLALSLALMSMGRRERAWSHQVWEHSNMAGKAASLVARAATRVPPQEAFVGGMLHDIGEMVLLHIKGEDYEDVLFAHEHTSEQKLVDEDRLYGCDHAVLGGACLTEWLLPGALCNAVRYHHDGEMLMALLDEGDPGLAHVVYLADHLATAVGRGVDGNALATELAEHPFAEEMELTAPMLALVIADLERG